MKISDWAKQAISLAIASWGVWNVAIANANAQLGNVVVYIAGNNPVTLNIARQVVTNPVVASVNGQTSIVAGAFDATTADFVSRELQRRGVAAQQAYISQTFQTTPTVNTSPYVTLPSYLPIPTAFVARSGRGNYIYAGGYPNRDAAESLKHFLRSQGLDARVLYF